MSIETTPRQSEVRSIARREATERVEGQQRRIAAYFAAATFTPGRFIHRHVMRQDYSEAAAELRKLMGR